MKTALQVCGCIALLACSWMCYVVARSVDRIAFASEELPILAADVLRHESEQARELAAGESKAWRLLVDRASKRTESILRAESGAWRNQTMASFDIAISKFDARAGAAVASVESSSIAASALMDEYRRLPLIVGERLDPWTQCKGNGACWQAQMTALLGATRSTVGETSRTMRSIRESTPSIVGNIDRTADNVAKMTQPDPLKWRILKILAPVAGGMIFGSIR